MRSVALDLAKKDITVCEVRGREVVFRTTVPDVRALERCLGPNTPPARVAIEACRESWFVAELLRGWGQEPVLVDTTRVKQLGIGAHGRKTDRIDAEVLARALDKDSIPLAHELSHPRQRLRVTLGARATLVESRAKMVVQLRGIARAEGVVLPSCSACNFGRMVGELRLPESIASIVSALGNAIRVLDTEIEKLDVDLGAQCEKDAAVTLLMTAPRVGMIVAAAFVSVVDDPSEGGRSRFASAHKLESYLGLVPSEDSTGGKRRLGSITKRGNSYLRAMLVESACGIVRSKDESDPLVAWGRALAKRKKKKQIATVAVARKLAGVLWAMWKRQRAYDPRWQHGKQTLAPVPPRDEDVERKARERATKKLARRTRIRAKGGAAATAS